VNFVGFVVAFTTLYVFLIVGRNVECKLLRFALQGRTWTWFIGLISRSVQVVYLVVCFSDKRNLPYNYAFALMVSQGSAVSRVAR